MCEKYSRSLLRISVAQICQNLGWSSAQSSSLEVLTDVLERYILNIGAVCHKFSEQYGRTEANLNDLGLAFQHLGINISELEDYIQHVEPVPFAHDVVAFPAPKSCNLAFPNPGSREILQHREEHIPDHLPYMFSHMRDEISEKKMSPHVNDDVSGFQPFNKTELSEDTVDSLEAATGDKRSGLASTPDLSASKRARLGNPNLPEEAAHSHYEMISVFMGPNGVLTTRQGCQGRLPESGLPPPNPRAVSEGANKENSGKTKELMTGTKVTGVVAEELPSSKSDSKKSKKSTYKKRLLASLKEPAFSNELGSEKMRKFKKSKELGQKSHHRPLLEGLGKDKKSLGSKAAAKFLKKLKLSNKSNKHFAKSRIKDLKMAEPHQDHELADQSQKYVTQTTQTRIEQVKKKKEKKSAEFIDSDEELRKLESPSSSHVPSPGMQAGSKGRAQMDAISDSINAVLRDEVKVKKKKRIEDKPEDVSSKHQIEGKLQEQKVKRKPGRPPKIQKTPEPATIVDVKPFVSDKYSSEELQVYEFNDSPPDANMSSRRPSAAEAVQGMPSQANMPPTPVLPPATAIKLEIVAATSIKHSVTSSSSSHKFHRRLEPEDDLFAPDIKIESRIDHSDSQSKLAKATKNKPQVKNEMKERAQEDVESKKKRVEKSSKHKSKAERPRDDKGDSRESKEKYKEKEHKKDKKEKKKDKEKKKKHKDHDNDKDKEKRAEDKVKKESRESSPAVGVGVKLKIKIGGGGAGTPTSLMVTGGDAPASPASSLSSKRESMSPPRVVPKLYILKKGQKREQKPKKTNRPSQLLEGSKSKSSPLVAAVQSRSASPSSSLSPRSTPTPPVPGKTTPPARSTPTPPVPSKTSTSPARSTPTPPVPSKTSTPPARSTPTPPVPSKTSTPPARSTPTPPVPSKTSTPPARSTPTPPVPSKTSTPPARSTPTPPVPGKTSTPPPGIKQSNKGKRSPSRKNKKQKDMPHRPSQDKQSLSPTQEKSKKHDKKNKNRKNSASSLSSLSSDSSLSPPPSKSLLPVRQTPPRLQRMSSSSSPERSPPSLPFQSPRSSPQAAAISPSHISTPHHSPPPSLSRRRPTPPPALSPPSNMSRSPTPSRPPTPGSTPPPPSPDWNLPVSSPAQPRSPTPTPRTPTASPSRNLPSPTHWSPPASPLAPSSRPSSRLMDTPEPKDNPSPASSGKSSSSAPKAARTVEAETVCVFYDDSGQKVWICPGCKLPDDGSEMIGCDMCDNWYHWPCVGITQAPPEEQQWFCSKCLPKTKSSIRGRGRPRGRGRGRGRKKIT